MRGVPGRPGALPGAPAGPGSAAGALARAVRLLAALPLSASMLLLISLVDLATASAGDTAARWIAVPQVAARPAPTSAVSAQDLFADAQLAVLETLHAVGMSPTPAGLQPRAPAAGPAAGRLTVAGLPAAPEQQTPGDSRLTPPPLSWAWRREPKIGRGRPPAPPDGDRDPGSDGPMVAGGPTMLPLPTLPALALSQAAFQAQADADPRAPDPSTDAEAAGPSFGLAVAKGALYTLPNRVLGYRLGYTHRNGLDELPGLVVADMLTQSMISDPSKVDTWSEAAGRAALVAATVYGMTWLNRQTYYHHRGLDATYYLNLGWHALTGIRPRNVPFLAARTPAAVAGTAGGLIFLEGPVREWLLGAREPGSANDYLKRLAYDMIVHGALTGTLMGTIDYRARGGGSSRIRPVHGTWLQQARMGVWWGAHDLNFFLASAREWPGWTGVVRQWGPLRYGLTAAAIAALSKGASEVITNPPPGAFGAAVRETAQAFNQLLMEPPAESFGQLLWSGLLNTAHAAWLVALDFVLRSLDPFLVSGRSSLSRKANDALLAGDLAEARRLRSEPAFDWVSRDTWPTAMAALDRGDRAFRQAVNYPEPQGPAQLALNLIDLAANVLDVAQAKVGVLPAGSAPRAQLVTEAKARVRQNLDQIDRNYAEVLTEVLDALMADPRVAATSPRATDADTRPPASRIPALPARTPVPADPALLPAGQALGPVGLGPVGRGFPSAGPALAPGAGRIGLPVEAGSTGGHGDERRLVLLPDNDVMPSPGAGPGPADLPLPQAEAGAGGDGGGGEDPRDAGRRPDPGSIVIVKLTVKDSAGQPVYRIEDDYVVFFQDTEFEGLPVEAGTIIDPDHNVWLPGSRAPAGNFFDLVANQQPAPAEPADPNPTGGDPGDQPAPPAGEQHGEQHSDGRPQPEGSPVPAAAAGGPDAAGAAAVETALTPSADLPPDPAVTSDLTDTSDTSDTSVSAADAGGFTGDRGGDLASLESGDFMSIGLGVT